MSRSKTTSIRRPRVAPASKKGTSRLGDITRSIPIDRRVVRRPQLAMFAGFAALAIVGTVAAAVFILPIGTWRDQDVDIRQRTAELGELQRVNGQLAAEVDRLGTEAGIQEAAKEEIGFTEPGEQRSSVLPLPALPTDLPDGWPYNVVIEIFAARTAGPAPVTTD